MRAVPAFLLSLMSVACAIQAQVQVQPPTRPPQAQDGGTREVLESIAIPPLANAPFSATLVTEWTRPMADGGSYTLTNRRRIARDSAGRIYEERWLLVPKGGDIKSSMNFIQIADPINRTLSTCSIFHKTCDLSAYHPSAYAAFEDEPPPLPGRSRDGTHTVENLGARNLFGLDTTGTRQITTVHQGTVGNDRPIQIVLEFWHSVAASEISARAANDNVNTLKNIERAWVVEKIRFPNRIPRQHETRGGVLQASFEFKNVGRQPAIIRNIQLRFHASEGLASLPE